MLENISGNVENIHKGHRQRLKEKVRKGGLKILDNHEVLELLLTYVIPQKDVNDLAHDLYRTFGSISKTIHADYHELLAVKGVGETTALFFNVLAELEAVEKSEKIKDYVINNTCAAVNFFRDNYCVEKDEKLYVVCLNGKLHVSSVHESVGFSDVMASIEIKKFANIVNADNTRAIIIMHTHPNGVATPSREDILATKEFVNICKALKVEVMDHIILTERDYYSFRNNNLILSQD